MTGLRLELGNPSAYPSTKDYVEQHLVPVVTELHRMVNELMQPGSTTPEESSIDYAPAVLNGKFRPLDVPLERHRKEVIFDGSSYFKMPAETLRAKRVKVQFQATVYVKDGEEASFRLTDEWGQVIQGSEFTINSVEPATCVRVLPFGQGIGLIAPEEKRYLIEGKGHQPGAIPVCRRFSLSFVYI